MNSCEYYQELISSLVDGEISQEENEALKLFSNNREQIITALKNNKFK